MLCVNISARYSYRLVSVIADGRAARNRNENTTKQKKSKKWRDKYFYGGSPPPAWRPARRRRADTVPVRSALTFGSVQRPDSRHALDSPRHWSRSLRGLFLAFSHRVHRRHDDRGSLTIAASDERLHSDVYRKTLESRRSLSLEPLATVFTASASASLSSPPPPLTAPPLPKIYIISRSPKLPSPQLSHLSPCPLLRPRFCLSLGSSGFPSISSTRPLVQLIVARPASARHRARTLGRGRLRFALANELASRLSPPLAAHCLSVVVVIRLFSVSVDSPLRRASSGTPECVSNVAFLDYSFRLFFYFYLFIYLFRYLL